MKRRIVAALAGTLLAPMAHALPVNGTGLVTSNAIFGSDNANGSFTGVVQNGIELGLRAKQRYPADNVFNYDGVRTYTFDSTVLTTNPANRSVFNFEFSVGVDPSGTSGTFIGDFHYVLSVDSDPSSNVNYSISRDVLFDFTDNSFGDRTTAQGAGLEPATSGVTDLATYLAFISDKTLMQNSQNLGFGFSSDPDLPGFYDFKIEAFDLAKTTLLASTDITVRVDPIPVPGALPLLATVIGGIAWMRRRKAGAA